MLISGRALWRLYRAGLDGPAPLSTLYLSSMRATLLRLDARRVCYLCGQRLARVQNGRKGVKVIKTALCMAHTQSLRFADLWTSRPPALEGAGDLPTG